MESWPLHENTIGESYRTSYAVESQSTCVALVFNFFVSSTIRLKPVIHSFSNFQSATRYPAQAERSKVKRQSQTTREYHINNPPISTMAEDSDDADEPMEYFYDLIVHARLPRQKKIFSHSCVAVDLFSRV